MAVSRRERLPGAGVLEDEPQDSVAVERKCQQLGEPAHATGKRGFRRRSPPVAVRPAPLAPGSRHR